MFDQQFSDSLIIYQIKTKKFTTVEEVLVPGLRPPPRYAGGIWKRSFISPVGPHLSRDIVHRKRSFSKTLLKTELCVLVWMENILKTELFDNDDVTIIKWFICPSLPQTQIQKGGQNDLKNGGKQQQKWLATWAHHLYVPLLSLGRH